mgnify:CR=1 FL=1
MSKDVKEVTIKIEGKTKSSWEDVGLILEKMRITMWRFRENIEVEIKNSLEWSANQIKRRIETLKTIDKQNAENLYFKLSKDDKK